MASVTWALGSAFYGRLSKEISPYAVNFWRALGSLPFCIAVALFVAPGDLLHSSWTPWGWFTISIVASFALADALFLKSIFHLGYPGALAVGSTYPIWSALGAWFFRGEKLTLQGGLGLVLTVGGVALVVANTPKAAEPDPIEGRKRNVRKGLLLACMTSFLWSLNAFSVAQGGQGINVWAANAMRMLIAVGLCMVSHNVFARSQPFRLTKTPLWRAFPVFFLEACLGSFCFTYGVTHSSLAIGSALTSLAPVVSVPIALVMGWERFSAKRFLGIFAVVLGVILLVSV